MAIRGTEASTHPEPIAIVGIGCRFPGGVDNPDRFWALLRDGVDAIEDFPAGRFDIDAYFDPTAPSPGKIITRKGGFLRDIDLFDVDFFGISPREAIAMDPQQRLLLETAWEALEDAGHPRERFAGSLTGVFVGVWAGDYENRTFELVEDIDLYATTGSGRYAASGRISFALDLRGPSLTVDTACSSSLVAVHLACKSLRDHECHLALSGGVNIIVQPEISIGYSRSRILSPDGRCMFGDAAANGYVRSEGCGLVVLKRLSDALTDGDDVYALIVGSATNNDGRGSGLLVQPAVEGQIAVLKDAYARAGITPNGVQYVEAHGTGTPAGDPVELEALGTVLGIDRSEHRPFRVGSVKTNIGHAEAASGIAGLIKVALALKHRALPESLHFSTPSPNVPWERLPLRIQQSFGPWPNEDELLLAGVNSFGITGTNAHLVLQELTTCYEPPAPSPAPCTPLLLPLSAQDPRALTELAGALVSYLETTPASLMDLCRTAGVRRTHLQERMALVVGSYADVMAGLESCGKGCQHPGLHIGRAEPEGPRIAFVFPGQGSQWQGMARELLATEPAFRSALERCDAVIEAETGWSVLAEVNANAGESRLDEIDVVQPVLFAVQVALAALWRSWGIVPDAVVGHSMGEVAAAHIAGALSTEAAAAIICRRSRLLRRVRGQGAMALVELTVDEARGALVGYEDVLSIGVSNGPRSTVLSGDPSALDEVLQRLQAADVFCRKVKVDVASHSPQVEPLLDDLRGALSDLMPSVATIPLYSTVEAAPLDGQHLDGEYWARNLRHAVLFGSTVQRLIDDGITVFVEISPHPILLPAVDEALKHNGIQNQALPSMRRAEPERATMLASLGALYVQGAAVDWHALCPVGNHLHLPTYPWQRERFWFDEGGAASRRAAGRVGDHPLLGHVFQPAGQSNTRNWELTVGTHRLPFLVDHRVGGAVIAPASAVIELLLAAATEILGTEALTIERLELREALVLPPDGDRSVQIAVVQRGSVLEMQMFGSEIGSAGDPTWRLHAVAHVRHLPVAERGQSEAPEAIRARGGVSAPADRHYAAMAERGLEYGPAFQTVLQVWNGKHEALGELRCNGADGNRGHVSRISLLDGALQLAVAAIPGSERGTYVPTQFEAIRIYATPEPGQPLWAHAIARSGAEDSNRSFDFDVRLLTDVGQVLVDVNGVRLASVDRAGLNDLAGWLYEVGWHEQPRPDSARGAAGAWLVLAPTMSGNGLAEELRAGGERCVIVAPGAATRRMGHDHYELDRSRPEDLADLVNEAFTSDAPPTGVVYAWSPAGYDRTNSESVDDAWVVITLTRILAGADWSAVPRLWLVTRCAQPAGHSLVDPRQALIWGIGRVVANEHPELRCTLIDLDPDVTYTSLCAELMATTDETQVALRGSDRYVARLDPRSPDTWLDSGVRRPAEPGEPFRIEVGRLGTLDSIGARPAPRRAPGPGEVELRVTAAGINFIDVMKAMGIYPGFEARSDIAIGGECSGTIVAVGPDVTAPAVGDEVIALTPSFHTTSCLAGYVTVPAELVALRPAHVSADAAAGMSIVYMTAYIALHELGRIRRGERVLIHAATGGVGLAALAVARRAGAEVFATAGSPEKRDYLRGLGIEHVYDSRSLAFADEVLTDTAGRGVDLVLNSLTGEAIAASLNTLAPRGRFIEIGKRDIYDNSRLGLAPFRKNLAFFALDLARMVEEDRPAIAELFQTVVQLLGTRELAPLPTRVYRAAEAADAFREMARAHHIGKLVVRLGNEPVEMLGGRALVVRPDASYMITGGLGALGLETARWLARSGARSLALMGRRGPSKAAGAAIAQLEESGLNVLVVQGDVANADDVKAALQAIDAVLPPLRGIFHAAGLLADATLMQLDRARLEECLAPKVAGAWNLHTQTVDRPLDCFVLFSSIAALLGLPGQANYAAANAYLDALAHHRHAMGLPALSVNWAPWAGIGLAAAEEQRGARLETQGLESLRPTRGIAALECLLGQDATEVAVLRLELARWAETHPGADTPFFEALRDGADVGSAPSLRDELLGVAPDRRLSLLEGFVRQQLSQVLRMAPERLTAGTPLKSLGLDSLMTLELRNRLEAGSGIALSATMAWNYPTIEALAEHLAARLELPLAMPESRDSDSGSVPFDDELEDLSQDEVATQLRDELDAIERLLRAD